MSKTSQETDEESETRELPAELTYAAWADAVRDNRLLGQACPDCGHVAGAPKGACAHCGSRDLETVELPTRGDVYSVTTINVPPEGFEERGYSVALVELDDGAAADGSAVDGGRVLVRIEEDVAIGDSVGLTDYIDVDDGHPAPVFSPE